MPKNDDVAHAEEIEAARAREAWDAEGGQRAPRPDEAGAQKSALRRPPLASRRGAERRQGDRRK